MNTKAHGLSGWSAVCLVIIGFPGAFPGPTFLPPSWRALWGFLPNWIDWVWPLIFVIAALLMFVGIFSARVMVPGFILGAVAYLIWGFASMYVWATNQDGSIPGSVTYFLVVGYMIHTAYTVHRDRGTDGKVAEIERVEIEADIENHKCLNNSPG